MSEETSNTSTTTAEPAKETFSREYVSELRAENKGWRLKAQELEQKTAKLAEEAEAKVKAALDEIAAKEQLAKDRIIRAELKAVALAAGLIDSDGLKLADLTKVALGEDGSIEGAKEAIEALKAAKPYLFQAASSASTATPPERRETAPKSATEMTPEEYAAARKAVTKR